LTTPDMIQRLQEARGTTAKRGARDAHSARGWSISNDSIRRGRPGLVGGVQPTALTRLPAVRHGSSSGPPGPGLCPGAATRRRAGRGRGDVRGHQGSRAGALAGRRAGGPADGDLPPAARAMGHDFETRRWGTATRDSDESGSRGANSGPVDPAADLRGRHGTHKPMAIVRGAREAHSARCGSRPPIPFGDVPRNRGRGSADGPHALVSPTILARAKPPWEVG
jgi:hypothetical protein